MAPSAMALGLCPFGSRTDWLDVGAASTPRPTPVPNGGVMGGSHVSASCTVRAVGSGFDVLANAALGGVGSVTIVSPQPPGSISATTGGVGVSGTFESASMGQFSASNCVVTYTYAGASVQDSAPIASGRIWGHLSCPEATDPTVNRTLPDGGIAPATCDFETDFLFEDCNP
jgi:hypothetical protein